MSGARVPSFTLRDAQSVNNKVLVRACQNRVIIYHAKEVPRGRRLSCQARVFRHLHFTKDETTFAASSFMLLGNGT